MDGMPRGGDGRKVLHRTRVIGYCGGFAVQLKVFFGWRYLRYPPNGDVRVWDDRDAACLVARRWALFGSDCLTDGVVIAEYG